MYRIVVVDDSPFVCSLYRHALTLLPGCAVSFAHNGRELLERLAAEGEPSMIFLDVNMPEMDGLSCLAHLQALGVTARVPVVLATTERSQEDVVRGLKAGAADYVKKPFRHTEIRAVVGRHIRAA